jgi:hypothetical protein
MTNTAALNEPRILTPVEYEQKDAHGVPDIKLQDAVYTLLWNISPNTLMTFSETTTKPFKLLAKFLSENSNNGMERYHLRDIGNPERDRDTCRRLEGSNAETGGIGGRRWG